MPRVIATATGFHGGARRRSGATFDVSEGTKGSWFKPFEGPEIQDAPVPPPRDNPPRPAKRKMRASDVQAGQDRAQTDHEED